jgi:predicted glycogen debranching enzyme
MTLSFGRGLCGTYPEAVEREWLETNGRGGYAMSTILGANTRRHHGVFTFAQQPPVRRFQVVNRLQEAVTRGETRVDLSSQGYPDTVHPMGFKNIESFRLDPFPVWTFAYSDVRLEKWFFLRYGEDTAVAIYRQVSGPPVSLDARPLLTCRGHHDLCREDGRFDDTLTIGTSDVTVALPDKRPVRIRAAGGTFFSDPFWYRNQDYMWEKRRGLEFREDAYAPGGFVFPLEPGRSVALVISVEERDPKDAPVWAEEERRFRAGVRARAKVRGPLAETLAGAADQFLVSRGEGMTIIAGYPWFEDWGRDAMISLPGLCLATGRPDDARRVLDTFAAHVRAGLLPNRFSDGAGTPEYNAMDAPLWFIAAAQKYFRATADVESLRRWLPVFRQMLDSYRHGTLFDMRMEKDGLLHAPDQEWALTWMDARVRDRPVTPRGGKPVEVQALWYNALQFVSELEIKFGEPSGDYPRLAAQARDSFNAKFWNPAAGYLHDRLDGDRGDPALRPNALIAASLPFEILEQSRFRPLVDTAWRALYTSYGLRTLAPEDASYFGSYTGPPDVRDRQYHQGPAWPWLMGPFLTVFVKAYGASEATKARLREFLTPFRDHMFEAGLGSVSELCEGNAPHRPRGCPWQAWSVAELLRVMDEEGVEL